MHIQAMCYFKFLIEQEYIEKNPMRSVPMIKKQNFMAAQGKENLPTSDTVTVFTDEEIAKFKEECIKTWGTGKRMYQQSAKSLTPRQVGDLLGHSTSQIAEMYYVKRDTSRLVGITDNFEF